MSDGAFDVDFMGVDPARTATTLESLAADIRALIAGKLPTPDDLLTAPLIRGWTYRQRPAICLSGTLHGHPTIVDGHTGLTSELYAIDPKRRWVRTLSRYYALGPVSMRGIE